MPGMDEAVAEFLVESHENLDQLDLDLVALEKDPADHETLARVFRAIHTIKGTCGFLGFSKLEAVTHAGEGLLSRLRDRDLTFTREIADGLLAMGDAVRRMLRAIEGSRSDGDEDHARLVEILMRLQKAGGPLAAQGGGSRSGASRGGAESSIRVDVEILDRLMTLVGELVLARNQILQITSSKPEPQLVSASQRLNLITTELQEGVMKTRMQPIANLWSRLPRQVRDLAAACGKKVRVEMDGMETELDRSLLEAIKDPLVHLARNAVDHGIEEPGAREAAGKSPEGRISLRARHEGGQVHIEIADDGAGVDPERVRQVAVQRGLIGPDHAGRMSDREALDMVFQPGFSTARKVTNVSGRGVGMDVVKTNVERLGGGVEIQSVKGQGCTIKIALPLTLAIIPALIVRNGGERYALPQASLLELICLEGKSAGRGIERVHGALVHRFRGSLLPIVDLGRELGGSPRSARSLPGRGAAVNIAVLRAEGRAFGLVVDGIEDTVEIVVKPLGRHLNKVSIFAGATILGDGRVTLILDVMGLARLARVVVEGGARAPAIAPAPERTEEMQTLLLFEIDGGGRMAVPLSSVARLEEFPRCAVEKVGSREVVQYRTEILPLIRVSRLFGGVAQEVGGFGPIQVVVYSNGSRSAGLVVDRIHDIVEEPLKIRWRGGSEGVAGSAVIQERITEVLDIPGLLRRHDPDLFESGALLSVRA